MDIQDQQEAEIRTTLSNVPAIIPNLPMLIKVSESELMESWIQTLVYNQQSPNWLSAIFALNQVLHCIYAVSAGNKAQENLYRTVLLEEVLRLEKELFPELFPPEA